MDWKLLAHQCPALRRLAADAIDAHHRGERWLTFIAEANPRLVDALGTAAYSRDIYQDARGHLMHLVLTGEHSGQFPPAVGVAWGEEEDDRFSAEG